MRPRWLLPRRNSTSSFHTAPGAYGSATRRDRAELVAGIERRPDARRDVAGRLSWLALVVALLLALPS